MTVWKCSNGVVCVAIQLLGHTLLLNYTNALGETRWLRII